jgi:hypothetical protein
VSAVNKRDVVVERYLEATTVETFDNRRHMSPQVDVVYGHVAHDAVDLASSVADLGLRVGLEACATYTMTATKRYERLALGADWALVIVPVCVRVVVGLRRVSDRLFTRA